MYEWGRATRLEQGGLTRSAVMLGIAAFFGAGCASSSYMGISLKSDEAAPDIRELARRAQAGDKQAQLDLGIRFEEGVGVPHDKVRATRLYQMAATDSGGAIWVYSPPIRNGAKGSLIRIERKPEMGLEEAKARLAKQSEVRE